MINCTIIPGNLKYLEVRNRLTRAFTMHIVYAVGTMENNSAIDNKQLLQFQIIENLSKKCDKLEINWDHPWGKLLLTGKIEFCSCLVAHIVLFCAIVVYFVLLWAIFKQLQLLNSFFFP